MPSEKTNLMNDCSAVFKESKQKRCKKKRKKAIRRGTCTTYVLFYVKTTETTSHLTKPPAATTYAGNRLVNCRW